MKTPDNRGFTLVEVVIVLTIMALLAIAALPKIIDVTNSAKRGSRDKIIASVREGIILQKINLISETSPFGSYPGNLDNKLNGSCQSNGGCFGNVLEDGQFIRTNDWQKEGGTTYRYDKNGSVDSTYDYNSSNGTFLCTLGTC